MNLSFLSIYTTPTIWLKGDFLISESIIFDKLSGELKKHYLADIVC